MKPVRQPVLYNTLMTVICFVFLVTAATWLVLSLTPVYGIQLKLFDIPENSGYSADLCMRNYQTLIAYNMFWGPDVLKFPDLRMSANAAIHFKEVKAIFVAMQYAAMVSGVLLIAGIVYGRIKKAYGWQKAVIILTLAVVVSLGAALIFAWDTTFVLMHKLLFRNDYWIFDPRTDPVIMILPDEVFLTDAALILLVIALGLVVCGIAYGHHRKQEGGKSGTKKANGARGSAKRSGKGGGKAAGTASGKKTGGNRSAAGNGSKKRSQKKTARK